MATLAEIERFETLWVRYVEALEALDSAREKLVSRHPGHAPRVARAARKRAEALHARLVAEYGMGHLSAVL